MLPLVIAGVDCMPASAGSSSPYTRSFLSTIDGTVFNTALNEDVQVQGRVRLTVQVSASRSGAHISTEVKPVGLVAVGLTSDRRFVASGESELSYSVPVFLFHPPDPILFSPGDPILFSLVFYPPDPVIPPDPIGPISVPLGVHVTFNSRGAATSAQVSVANPGCSSP